MAPVLVCGLRGFAGTGRSPCLTLTIGNVRLSLTETVKSAIPLHDKSSRDGSTVSEVTDVSPGTRSALTPFLVVLLTT